MLQVRGGSTHQQLYILKVQEDMMQLVILYSHLLSCIHIFTKYRLHYPFFFSFKPVFTITPQLLSP